jgi:hypothetical protein
MFDGEKEGGKYLLSQTDRTRLAVPGEYHYLKFLDKVSILLKLQFNHCTMAGNASNSS